MNHHTPASGPLEVAAAWILGIAIVVVGLTWGSGMIVAAFIGASIPAGGEGVAAIVAAFPDVGQAWSPKIPTPLMGLAATVTCVAVAPLAVGLYRALRPDRRGARWADTIHLRKAGLIVDSKPLQASFLETGTDHD